MKKSRLLLALLAIPFAVSLSSCALFDWISGGDETVVETPTIDVVSTMKINLRSKSSKTLTPKLKNSTITNPVFVYSSSNTAVATVSSDGVVQGLSVGSTVVTISLKNNSKVNATVTVTVVDEEKDLYDYTLMFYMCGSTLEYDPEEYNPSNQGFFTKDIQEMLSVTNMPDSVRIIIETGGATKWYMESSYLEGATSISKTNLQRWEINNSTHKLKLIENLSTNEMAKSSSFQDFLTWGLNNYEAEQMGVIISGHGGGIAGCAFDDNYLDSEGYSNSLNNAEVAKACEAALANSDRDKFTWIGYDCCLMQTADTATVNAQYFDYMVAAQESELASGWDHDVYFKKIRDNPSVTPEELLPEICDSFVKQYHSDSESGSSKCLQTLSALDLSKTSALVSAFDTLCTKVGTGSSGYATFKSAFQNSYNEFGEQCYGLCDFNSFVSKLSSSFSSEKTAVTNAVNDLVISNKYCSKYSISPCGLNAFFPLCTDNRSQLRPGRSDYEDLIYTTKFSKWQTMCLLYGNFDW